MTKPGSRFLRYGSNVSDALRPPNVVVVVAACSQPIDELQNEDLRNVPLAL